MDPLLMHMGSVFSPVSSFVRKYGVPSFFVGID